MSLRPWRQVKRQRSSLSSLPWRAPPSSRLSIRSYASQGSIRRVLSDSENKPPRDPTGGKNFALALWVSDPITATMTTLRSAHSDRPWGIKQPPPAYAFVYTHLRNETIGNVTERLQSYVAQTSKFQIYANAIKLVTIKDTHQARVYVGRGKNDLGNCLGKLRHKLLKKPKNQPRFLDQVNEDMTGNQLHWLLLKGLPEADKDVRKDAKTILAEIREKETKGTMMGFILLKKERRSEIPLEQGRVEAIKSWTEVERFEFTKTPKVPRLVRSLSQEANSTWEPSLSKPPLRKAPPDALRHQQPTGAKKWAKRSSRRDPRGRLMK